MWIFLALVAIPIIEIALFIEIGGWIGLWPTIGVVILTALVGTLLLRQQGFATINDLQNRLNEGRDPSVALAHGAMILVAGVVLLTPGFFTDAVGFLLLIPPVRDVMIRVISERIRAHTVARQANAPAADTTIDGEFEDLTQDDQHDQRTDPGTSGWTRHDSFDKDPR